MERFDTDRAGTLEVQLVQPLATGELVLRLRATQLRGSVRPYIVRRISVSHAREKQENEQHTIIKDRRDLIDWIARDELSTTYPEFFEQLRSCCEELMR